MGKQIWSQNKQITIVQVKVTKQLFWSERFWAAAGVRFSPAKAARNAQHKTLNALKMPQIAHLEFSFRLNVQYTL